MFCRELCTIHIQEKWKKSRANVGIIHEFTIIDLNFGNMVKNPRIQFC